MSRSAFGCRACGGADVQPVVSLGETPLANALLTADELAQPEDRFPLDVVRCRACSLVQITETVPPERLFRHYAYFSSFSDTMVRHAQALVDRLIDGRALGPSSLAMEIASNDGYLLQFYRRRGVPVLGIEPAENVAAVARGRGIETLSEFFDASLGAALRAQGRRADVLHAHNVLAHVPDVTGFAEGIAAALVPGGVAVLEVPYVRPLIEDCEFDTIYHEHLSYFSLTALDRLFRQAGLHIVNVESLAMHGGSLRLFVAHESERQVEPSVSQLLEEERAWGVDREETYANFGARVRTLLQTLRQALQEWKRQGRRLAAYGAAAKGSTLLNVGGIDGRLLDFVADRSPHKQGLYMPGVHLPIVGPEQLVQQQPDLVLLLTWNFADEILAQQTEYRARGGKFIIPVPRVRVV